jgi:hypothetical protein
MKVSGELQALAILFPKKFVWVEVRVTVPLLLTSLNIFTGDSFVIAFD